MKQLEKKQHSARQRVGRVRAKIRRGDTAHPRLVVAKTNKHIWLQIIDDLAGTTLASAYDGDIKQKEKKPMEVARELGALLAQRALEKKVSLVVFDRGKNKYHGIVRAVAEGAREGGLRF